jgi:hypothetical protein
MNYSIINKALFILINLSWVVVVFYSFVKFTLDGTIEFDFTIVTTITFMLMMIFLQVVGFFKLYKGETTIPIIAVILLAFIIDLDGFQHINILLANIFIVIDAGEGLIFEASLQGPRTNLNLRFSDFSFKQIGFNGIAYIQMFFLLQQESLISSNPEKKRNEENKLES